MRGKLAPAAFLSRLRLWTSRWTKRGYTDRRAPPTAGIFLAKTSLSQSWSAPISPTSAAVSVSTGSARACRRRPAARSWSVAAARAGLAFRR